MIINNVLLDENNNKLKINDLQPNSADSTEDNEERGREIVYAHVDIVNENGFQLNADSIEVTREKYPLLFEHNDNRVEDVVGYVVTDGKPNDKGEFVGNVFFYETEQGQHAAKLVEDEVINELSVSYYVKDFDYIKPQDGEAYLNIKHALLKEISLVSVGADRDTKINNNKDGSDNEQNREIGNNEQCKDKSDNGKESGEVTNIQSEEPKIKADKLEASAEDFKNAPGETSLKNDEQKLEVLKLNLLKDFID